ncbi:PDR/VanB family oxidoreductase [Piscinibacter koreensis]|uniref:PDR/VanB family oxidoreductase n=1 Tax=Piscinibacter koreensis TaxID=2742824 RepID=UPI00315836EE
MAIREEAIDIKSFELVGADEEALPLFTPGSHIDVHVAPGLVRQYSLCNAPSETDCYRIAVKRESDSRGGSSFLHSSLCVGDVIEIGAPRNNFALKPPRGPVLLVGAGIGVTPLLSMALHLQEEGAAYSLHYFTRSIAHTAFHSLLSERRFLGRVDFHYATEPDAVRAYLRRLLWNRPEGAELYLCGPRPFMDLVESTAASTWPPDSVHLEYFSAGTAALAGPRDSFIIRLARTGGEHLVGADQTIAGVLRDAGVAIETSCEQGVCGTCLTGVLSGVPDHRDVFLTDEEQAAGDKIMCCVSRAKTAVLELDI